MTSKNKNQKIDIGIVGATGMVGEVFLDLLAEREFPVGDLRLFASESSLGQKIAFQGKDYFCEVLKENCFQGLDLVFFSSGDDISKEWAPKAVADGAFAVDNSAAFRMSDSHKLIVPEINGHLLRNLTKPEVIANPNCSTIQLVVALKALEPWGLERVHVATYQSVSGAGKLGREELLSQLKDYFETGRECSEKSPQVFSQQIAFNSLPHIGSFNSEGFSSEEMKIRNETKKILDCPNLKVTAFTVRVPTINGHGEVAWVELQKDASKQDLESALSNFPGIKYLPHSEPSEYPTVLKSHQTNEVYIGRLHKDLDNANTWMFWVVADNLRKGAAYNGLQIAEELFCR